MKKYKIGQIVEYSKYKWKIHSILWIRTIKGKDKKLRLMSIEGDVKSAWENICPYFLHCEINVNKLN